jgi:CBS domain containing-hemolysin-like protein
MVGYFPSLDGWLLSFPFLSSLSNLVWYGSSQFWVFLTYPFLHGFLTFILPSLLTSLSFSPSFLPSFLPLLFLVGFNGVCYNLSSQFCVVLVFLSLSYSFSFSSFFAPFLTFLAYLTFPFASPLSYCFGSFFPSTSKIPSIL